MQFLLFLSVDLVFIRFVILLNMFCFMLGISEWGGLAIFRKRSHKFDNYISIISYFSSNSTVDSATLSTKQGCCVLIVCSSFCRSLPYIQQTVWLEHALFPAQPAGQHAEL